MPGEFLLSSTSWEETTQGEIQCRCSSKKSLLQCVEHSGTWEGCCFQGDSVNQIGRYLKELVVPAAFITKSTGDILKNLIKTGNVEEAYVVMDWVDVLPRASKVNWQFWSG